MGVGSPETQSKSLITDGEKAVGSGIGSERKMLPLWGQGLDLKSYRKPGLGEREEDRTRGGCTVTGAGASCLGRRRG